MIYSPQELKLRVIEFLRDSKERFSGPDPSGNYIVECPYCGDSQNSRHGHFYIKINPADNSSMVYNCFRCPAQGLVTKDVLERLGMVEASVLGSVDVMNRNAPIKDIERYVSENSIRRFDYKLPKITSRAEKVAYVENRLGLKFSDEDLVRLKIITSFKNFIDINGISELTCNKAVANAFEYNYVGFLSYGNSHILFRDVTEKMPLSWVKYPINIESKNSICFYSIAQSVDPFYDGDITINLSEGVMDCIGVAYHLDCLKENTINISVGGGYYERIVRALIQMGFVGNNVSVNIYADNDATFNKKANPTASIERYKKIFYTRKKFFREMKVMYNLMSKDYGITADKISVTEHRL